MIKSVGTNQHKIINDIIKLHIPEGQIQVDLTYSIGKFYSTGEVPEPWIKCDKYPINGVQQLDEWYAKAMSNNYFSIMFDPPFVIGKGPSLNNNISSQNKIIKRFDGYASPKELFSSYKEHLVQCYRLLKDNGVLIFKCQDTVSSGKNYMTHVWVMNETLKLGLYPLDLFILTANNRLISGKIKKQQYARKYHSYFWVFKKCETKINYDILC